MEEYPFHWKLDPALMEIKVRLSIFIIIGACAGLPALVWSVSGLIHHRKNGHRISAFIILLLLTDFVELFLSPYILIKYLLNGNFRYNDWTYRVLFSLWLLSREYGLLLNQLVALEGILSVRFPVYTAAVFSSPCFIIFYIIVFLCFIIIEILFMQKYHFFIDISLFIVSVITWILSCRASCSVDQHSHTSRKLDGHILVAFIFTLLVLYLPLTLLSFFSYFTSYNFLPVWNIPWFFMSVRLISDPLLCVLVCRQNLSIHTSQKPEETSLV